MKSTNNVQPLKKTKPVPIDSITLQRDGEYTIVSVEVAGKRYQIIRTRYDNWFYETITADGIRFDIKKHKEQSEKNGWKGPRKTK